MRGLALAIIATSLSENVISTLVVNKLKGILRIVAVETPSYSVRRSEILTDLACMTGSIVLGGASSRRKGKMDPRDFGYSISIDISSIQSSIICDSTFEPLVMSRKSKLQRRLIITSSIQSRIYLKASLSRLSGCLAVLLL